MPHGSRWGGNRASDVATTSTWRVSYPHLWELTIFFCMLQRANCDRFVEDTDCVIRLKMTAKAHILHDNPVWIEPLAAELSRRKISFDAWDLRSAALDLSKRPPNGVFLSRISASAYTRKGRAVAAYGGAILDWLLGHQRRVINGPKALALELSKAAQHLALARSGINAPQAVLGSSADELARLAAQRLKSPWIVKPNRAGKGFGVRRVDQAERLMTQIQGVLAESFDGIVMVQRYIEAPEPHVTRLEFVGGRFVYALRVSTDAGFELCPAEACDVGGGPRFLLQRNFDHPLVAQYEQFLQANEISVAGIEFIVDRAGCPYTYDVNTTTNYNAKVESNAEVSATARLVDLLACELRHAT